MLRSNMTSLFALFVTLSFIAGWGATSQSGLTNGPDSSPDIDTLTALEERDASENPTSDENKVENSDQQEVPAGVTNDKPEVDDGGDSKGSVKAKNSPTGTETGQCGVGVCELGATCSTDERRCVCVVRRSCSGVERPMNHPANAPTNGWQCQDSRCPHDLNPILSSGCTNERLSYNEACRTAIRCKHANLHCGASSGQGCGGTAVSCVKGRWEYQMSAPAP